MVYYLTMETKQATGLYTERTEMKNLHALRDAMKSNDPRVMDKHGQWRSDLPTYGGPEPTVTAGVWSWDQSNVLIGDCASELTIERRGS